MLMSISSSFTFHFELSVLAGTDKFMFGVYRIAGHFDGDIVLAYFGDL